MDSVSFFAGLCVGGFLGATVTLIVFAALVAGSNSDSRSGAVQEPQGWEYRKGDTK